MQMRDIKTERLILRQTNLEDKENIFKVLSNPKVIENLNMNLHGNIDDTEKLLEDYFEGIKTGTKFPFTIIDSESGNFVGIFLLKVDLYNEEAFEFTIYLEEDFWGRGFYTEILPYMIELVFENIKTKNFRGYVMEKNISSRKVLEKSNFVLEKIFKVPGIEERIYSFLITKEGYEKLRR